MTTSVVMTFSDMNRSELLVWDAHDETVKRIGDLDLAGKPARRPYIEGEVEHVFLHLFRRARLLAPSLVDIDVAGRAGAGATAFGGDAGDVILYRRFHHGHARFRLDHALDPIVLNKSNPGHHIGGLQSLPISGIGPRLTRARKAKARRGSPRSRPVLYRAIESQTPAPSRRRFGVVSQAVASIDLRIHRLRFNRVRGGSIS